MKKLRGKLNEIKFHDQGMQGEYTGYSALTSGYFCPWRKKKQKQKQKQKQKKNYDPEREQDVVHFWLRFLSQRKVVMIASRAGKLRYWPWCH